MNQSDRPGGQPKHCARSALPTQKRATPESFTSIPAAICSEDAFVWLLVHIPILPGMFGVIQRLFQVHDVNEPYLSETQQVVLLIYCFLMWFFAFLDTYKLKKSNQPGSDSYRIWLLPLLAAPTPQIYLLVRAIYLREYPLHWIVCSWWILLSYCLSHYLYG
jgi:hypothetical protein